MTQAQLAIPVPPVILDLRETQVLPAQTDARSCPALWILRLREATATSTSTRVATTCSGLRLQACGRLACRWSDLLEQQAPKGMLVPQVLLGLKVTQDPLGQQALKVIPDRLVLRAILGPKATPVLLARRDLPAPEYPPVVRLTKSFARSTGLTTTPSGETRTTS